MHDAIVLFQDIRVRLLVPVHARTSSTNSGSIERAFDQFVSDQQQYIDDDDIATKISQAVETNHLHDRLFGSKRRKGLLAQKCQP